MTPPPLASINAADDEGLNACVCLARAVVACQGGHTDQQTELVAKAAEHFARALSLLNPATAEQPITERVAA